MNLDYHDMELTAVLALFLLVVAVVSWLMKTADRRRPLRWVRLFLLLLCVVFVALTFMLSLTIP